jgi:hypothetical protein
MMANPENANPEKTAESAEKKAENPEKKQSWLLTVPGFLTATATLLTAIGATITLLVNAFNPTERTSPPPPQATATGPTPPRDITTISLPGADWQGWLDELAARCRGQDHAVAIGRTDVGSKLVVCFAGPGDFYFRAVTPDGRAIELPGVKRNEGGFDVTTEVESKIFERRIRSDQLTILENGKVIASEEWRGYTAS